MVNQANIKIHSKTILTTGCHSSYIKVERTQSREWRLMKVFVFTVYYSWQQWSNVSFNYYLFSHLGSSHHWLIHSQSTYSYPPWGHTVPLLLSLTINIPFSFEVSPWIFHVSELPIYMVVYITTSNHCAWAIIMTCICKVLKNNSTTQPPSLACIVLMSYGFLQHAVK